MAKDILPIESNAQHAVAVSPNDSTNLTMPSGTKYTKGLYVGTSGNVKVRMASGVDASFNNLASGVIHPLAVDRVYLTGTAASDIVAVY